MLSASFTKLPSGAWGLRILHRAPLTAGHIVQVRRADGRLFRATVGKIVWRGVGVALTTIKGDIVLQGVASLKV